MSIERELLQRAINELVEYYLPDTASKEDYPSTINLIEEIKSVLDKPEQIPYQDRKPLTDDEIMFLTTGKVNPLGGIYASSIIDFARCIEEAHGIMYKNED